jgi:hypothetical protein
LALTFARLKDFLFYRQIFRPALSALLLARTFERSATGLKASPLGVATAFFSGGVGFSQFIFFEEQFRNSSISSSAKSRFSLLEPKRR